MRALGRGQRCGGGAGALRRLAARGGRALDRQRVRPSIPIPFSFSVLLLISVPVSILVLVLLLVSVSLLVFVSSPVPLPVSIPILVLIPLSFIGLEQEADGLALLAGAGCLGLDGGLAGRLGAVLVRHWGVPSVRLAIVVVVRGAMVRVVVVMGERRSGFGGGR